MFEYPRIDFVLVWLGDSATFGPILREDETPRHPVKGGGELRHGVRGNPFEQDAPQYCNPAQCNAFGKKGSSAIKQGYIHHDPTQGLELPPMEDRTIVPPTQALVWKLINVATFFGQNADAMIHLAAFTGLRRGELLALLFTDIDWSNKEIIVTKALTRFPAKDGVHRWRWEIGPRRLVLSDDILLYLTQMRNSAPNPIGLLFPHKKGKPLDPGFFDSLFAKTKRSAGLQEIRFHDLRHFFASLLISQDSAPSTSVISWGTQVSR